MVTRRAPLDRDAQSRHYDRDEPLAPGVHVVADGRRRYIGQSRRGKPSVATAHGMNLRLAIAELEACHELVVRAAVNEMTPRERAEHRAVVAAKVALAVRLAEDVAEPANGRGPT